VPIGGISTREPDEGIKAAVIIGNIGKAITVVK
jgi:hypothetical protein